MIGRSYSQKKKMTHGYCTLGPGSIDTYCHASSIHTFLGHVHSEQHASMEASHVNTHSFNFAIVETNV